MLSGLLAAVLTIPAVASLPGVGGVRFQSDLWLYNDSAEDAVTVTLTYRCLRSLPCEPPPREVRLAPQRSLLLEDVAGALLESPGTAGPLEVSFLDGAGPVGVASRVYASAAAGTFGTPVPALTASAARLRSVLVGARGGPAYRSNAGVYNPGTRPAALVLALYAAAGRLLGALGEGLGPGQALQVDDVFSALGAAPAGDATAVLAVSSTAPVVSYLAVVDNASGDAVLQTPVEDEDVSSPVLAGAWSGRFESPNLFLDCDVPESAAHAEFLETGGAVAAVLDAHGSDCGFRDGLFTGTLRGGAVAGTLAVDGWSAPAGGPLSGTELMLDTAFGRFYLHR